MRPPQDFFDDDEIDIEVEEAIGEFERELLTFDELKAIVGVDVAKNVQARVYGSSYESLFDDPEDL